MADLQASLKEQTELAAKYRSVAEPDNSLFWEKGHISAHMDRAGIEALQLGVSCKKLPAILRWAARTFGVKVPTRTIKVQAARVDGKRVCAEREIDLLFGETHAKELRATMRQLNKLQAAEWMGDLLTDESKSCCYLADGAESMQHEWLGTILSKRGANGKLQLFAVDYLRPYHTKYVARATHLVLALWVSLSIATPSTMTGITHGQSFPRPLYNRVSRPSRLGELRRNSLFVIRARNAPNCVSHMVRPLRYLLDTSERLGINWASAGQLSATISRVL